jgi:hypothetical protein
MVVCQSPNRVNTTGSTNPVMALIASPSSVSTFTANGCPSDVETTRAGWRLASVGVGRMPRGHVPPHEIGGVARWPVAGRVGKFRVEQGTGPLQGAVHRRGGRVEQ